MTNLATAFFVTLTAVPIYVFIFGGATGHFADLMTAAFLGMGQNLFSAVFMSNILVSMPDKIIAGYVALAIIEALPANLTQGLRLPEAQGLRKIIVPIIGIVIGVAFILIILALGVI